MIIRFFQRGGGGAAATASEAVVMTTCVMGTHRSVAAAEIIAREVRRWGVEVRVRHLDRKRMVGDVR